MLLRPLTKDSPSSHKVAFQVGGFWGVPRALVPRNCRTKQIVQQAYPTPT